MREKDGSSKDRVLQNGERVSVRKVRWVGGDDRSWMYTEGRSEGGGGLKL